MMKKISKILAFILMFSTLVLSLTACGSDPTKEAQAAVEKEFEALKNKDEKAFEELFGSNPLDSLGITSDNAEENFKKIVNKILEGIDYSIISSEKIDNENVTVKVDITSLNMEDVMQKYMESIVDFSLNEEAASLSEEETNDKIVELLLETISQPDLETVKTTVDINVKKVDNKWTIQESDELTNALAGGLQ